VEPGGANLVNVFATLKNQRNWRETLGRLQVALGEIEDVLLVSEPSGGTQMLWIRWANGLEIPLSGLSDGQISVLALIAIQQLKRPTPPSLIALDEPEIHLHPGLVARVAMGLQEMSEEVPILVGTQSDAFLNVIERPEDSVVLCQLDEQRRAVLRRPDRGQLEHWLTEFKGLGEMRSEGLQSVLFPASQ
jgi:predicted ATPase